MVHHFQKVYAFLTQNPYMIHDEEISFFKKFMTTYKLPEQHIEEDEEESPPYFDKDETSEEKFDSAISHFKYERYDEFITLMQELLQVEEYCNSRNYALMAEAYKASEKYTDALHYCQKALDENPNSVKALRVAGIIHVKQKNWKEAVSCISNAQSLDFDESLRKIHNEAIFHSRHSVQQKNDVNESPNIQIPNNLSSSDMMNGIQEILQNPDTMHQIMNNPMMQQLASSFMQGKQKI